jgi:hypothetical protein
VLANSGIRPGEARKLKLRDVHPFRDEKGRSNYRLIVRGKTGERDAILRSVAAKRLYKYLAKRRAAGFSGIAVRYAGWVEGLLPDRSTECSPKHCANKDTQSLIKLSGACWAKWALVDRQMPKRGRVASIRIATRSSSISMHLSKSSDASVNPLSWWIPMRTLRPKGKPEPVRVHDFIIKEKVRFPPSVCTTLPPTRVGSMSALIMTRL